MTQELYHHGIKGQKWGVRRYQNEDGSLTNAGKARQKKKNSKDYPSEEEMKAIIKEKATKDAYDKAVGNKLDKAKSAANATRDSINTIKNSYKNLKDANKPKVTVDVSKMSNKELQDAITRMNLEDNYTRLIQNRQNVETGQDYVETTLDVLGTVSNVAIAGLTIAGLVKALK